VADPFPDYDVLAKRGTVSWNQQTRKVIADRLALQVPPHPLSETQLATLRRVVQRVVPDPEGRPPTTTLAMIVRKIAQDERDGYRHHALPGTRECWQRGLDAIHCEAQARRQCAFIALPDVEADTILECIAEGEVRAVEWEALPPKLFWFWRLLPDCVTAHWAQPSLWSAMGFGGPASPRGYVRTGIDRRDPWEAIEAGETLRGLPRHHG
jgi:hypothetical protein